MQHLKAGEMAANANESEIVVQPMRLAFPEHDRGIRILHPFAFRLVQIDGNAAERATPFDHAAVIMRMGNGDGSQTAERFHQPDGAGIKQADAIPQDSAISRLQQQRPLPDPKLRLRVNSPNAFAFHKENVAMRLSASLRE